MVVIEFGGRSVVDLDVEIGVFVIGEGEGIGVDWGEGC